MGTVAYVSLDFVLFLFIFLVMVLMHTQKLNPRNHSFTFYKCIKMRKGKEKLWH